MAIDTADKRASTIGSGLEFLTVFPEPDSDIDELDRPQAAGFYAMAGALVVAQVVGIARIAAALTNRTTAANTARLGAAYSMGITAQ